MANEIYALPNYVGLRSDQQLEFLRSHGLSGSVNEQLFKKLCEMQSAKVSYSDFASGLDSGSQSALFPFLTKLSREGMAVLYSKRTGENEVPTSIILTEPRASSFYAATLANELEKIRLDDIEFKLPRPTIFTELSLPAPPPSIFVPLETAHLTVSFVQKEKTNVGVIYQLVTDDGDNCIVPAFYLSTFIDMAVSLWLLFLKRFQLVPILSSLLIDSKGGSSQIDEAIEKDLKSKSLPRIAELSSIATEHRNDFPPSKLHHPEKFFFLAAILHGYAGSAKVNEEEEVEAENHIQAEMKRFYTSVRDAPNLYISYVDLMREFKEILAEDSDFLSKVQSDYMSAPGGLLPKIVKLGDNLIASKNLYPYVTEALPGASDKVKQELIKKFHEKLKKRDFPFLEDTLVSRETYNSMLWDLLQQASPLLADIFAKPKLFLAAIHQSVDASGSGALKQVQKMTFLFFRPKYNTLYSMDRLLDINAYQSFVRAFHALGGFKAFFLRLNRRFRHIRQRAGRLSSLAASEIKKDSGVFIGKRRKK